MSWPVGMDTVADLRAKLARAEEDARKLSRRVLRLDAALLELGHHSDGQPCEAGWGYDYGKPCPGCTVLGPAAPTEEAP